MPGTVLHLLQLRARTRLQVDCHSLELVEGGCQAVLLRQPGLPVSIVGRLSSGQLVLDSAQCLRQLCGLLGRVPLDDILQQTSQPEL